MMLTALWQQVAADKLAPTPFVTKYLSCDGGIAMTGRLCQARSAPQLAAQQ
jgi:hypothetical protein